MLSLVRAARSRQAFSYDLISVVLYLELLPSPFKYGFRCRTAETANPASTPHTFHAPFTRCLWILSIGSVEACSGVLGMSSAHHGNGLLRVIINRIVESACVCYCLQCLRRTTRPSRRPFSFPTGFVSA